MFENLQIVIPSRSRATTQKTIYSLSKELWPHITLVVPHVQYNLYRAKTPLDINLIPFEEVNGVGNKRQFILNMKKSGKLIMMDDDLRFYRRTKEGTRFPPASLMETEIMVSEIMSYLDQYCMAGLVDKFMSQTKPRQFVECQRFNQVLAFNRDTLPKPWPVFRLPHDEEHDVHLQLLTKGHKTAVLTEWSKSDVPDAAGGCSDWRIRNDMHSVHKQLKDLWGGIVAIIPNPDRARYNWKEAKRQGGLLSGEE